MCAVKETRFTIRRYLADHWVILVCMSSGPWGGGGGEYLILQIVVGLSLPLETLTQVCTKIGNSSDISSEQNV